MVTEDQIRDLRKESDDYELAEELKEAFGVHRNEREPFYLTQQEMDQIFRWKLRQQYGRQASLRAKNSDNTYRKVTQIALNIFDNDFRYECAVRFGLLSALPGIGVPVASAVLALTEPNRYCVIDFRGWRAVFGEDRRNFTVPDYLRYRDKVNILAKSLQWPIQETDMAIWEFDRQRQSG